MFELSHSARDLTQAGYKSGGSDTDSATCTLLNSRLWRRTESPALPGHLGWDAGHRELSAATPRQDRWRDRARHRGNGPRGDANPSGRGPGLRGRGGEGGRAAVPIRRQSYGQGGSLTDYTHTS